jgi:membrane-bound lytic murein transglycosylase D
LQADNSNETGGTSVTAAQAEIEKIANRSVRAVPFWENLESDEIFANLNLSEILHIDPEVSPHIGNGVADRVLLDFQGRIAPEFVVPDLIFNQTKFWFRVYTEFDSNKKIIHDSLHPHIIFDIVDVSDIMAQPARAQWLNTVKAQKLVSKRMNEIRNQLKKMAGKKKEDMSTQELSWLSQFEGIRGNQKKIILTSAQSLRVQTGQKDFFEGALATSGRYLDGMESIFKRKGLPIELTRLPFVESSFVIGATSKVGAAGIWQFMPGVGRQFMRVNDQVDERRSPWKATEAAAKLLKENFIILHKKWGLALTAYNHGPGGVRKAMERTGSQDIATIVRSYRSKSFDFASANFYTCFLAAVHAQMYRDMLWPDRLPDAALAYDSVLLKKAYRPRQLISMTGLSSEQILLYNPELDRSFRRNYVIPKGYRLFLPSEIKISMRN